MNIKCDTVCMDRRKTLGRALHRYRMPRGLRLEDLAPLLGLKARVTVGALERGEPVKEFTYHALDRYFGWPHNTTVDYLAGEIDELPEMLEPVPAEFKDDPNERAIWLLEDLSKTRRRELIRELRAARGRARSKREKAAEEASEADWPLCGEG